MTMTMMMCHLNLRPFGKLSSGKKNVLKKFCFLGTAPRQIIWVQYKSDLMCM